MLFRLAHCGWGNLRGPLLLYRRLSDGWRLSRLGRCAGRRCCISVTPGGREGSLLFRRGLVQTFSSLRFRSRLGWSSLASRLTSLLKFLPDLLLAGLISSSLGQNVRSLTTPWL